MALSFKVNKNGIELTEPRLPGLSSVRGRTLAVISMLFGLMNKGVYLTPQPRDAELVPGLTIKV